MRNLLLSSIFFGIILLFGSCEESFEVFAPYEDIWVVYGILKPDADTQTIRVSKAFQIEADAFEYAKTHDPSIKGLHVTLIGDGQVFEAIPRDNVPKDTTTGDFGATTHIYQIPTPRDNRLKPGITYSLTVRSENEPDLEIQSKATIPPKPKIITPSVWRSAGEHCLQSVPFEDSVFVRFQINPDRTEGKAAAFEIRVVLEFEENGIPRKHHFGPTKAFSRSRGCSNGLNDALCYLLREKEVIRGLRTAFKDPNALYTYESEPRCNGRFDPLSDALELQVTAIDSSLATYLLANDPSFFELNNVRPEYTNITGTVRTLGVFGAISYHNIPVSLTSCGEYLLGLRTNRPFGNCE